jgi:hypothetical protein
MQTKISCFYGFVVSLSEKNTALLFAKHLEQYYTRITTLQVMSEITKVTDRIIHFNTFIMW